MKGRLDWRAATVVSVEERGPVRIIECAPEGAVGAFDPGSHTNFEVRLADGIGTRSYSCLPAPRGRIRVGVRTHAQSRGGSAFMWTLKQGDRVRMSMPENRFALSWRAPKCLLVAGGIGATPLIGMAQALARSGVDVRFAYAISARADAVFESELSRIDGLDLEVFADDEGRQLDLAHEIAALPEDGELYICGPVGMLNEAKALWQAAGRPTSRLRFEVFGAGGEDGDKPFTLHVANLDGAIQVPPGRSILDALTQAGVDMVWDCLRGECGLCAVDVLSIEGEIDHRDVFFSEAQKAEGNRLCACVSRLKGGSATIDTGFRPSEEAR